MNWRELFIAEARTWVGTPYRHAQCLKGAGVDCVMLLVACGKVAGIVEPEYDPRPYPQFWFLHHNEELYLKGILKYAKRTMFPIAGDVAMYRFGRTASHAAIVLSDDYILHAFARAGCVEIAESRTFLRRLDSYWTVPT